MPQILQHGLISSNQITLFWVSWRKQDVVITVCYSREAESYDLGEKFAFKLASVAVYETRGYLSGHEVAWEHPFWDKQFGSW